MTDDDMVIEVKGFWAVYSNPAEVIPLYDEQYHNFGLDCWCNPQVSNEGILVHNSFDGREAYEQGIRKRH